MYPQYSATTVASNTDAVFRHLLTLRNVPTLRVAEPYFRDPDYVNALATTINESLAAMEAPPQRLVFSYHGIPEEYVRKGDVYCCQCAETSRALIPRLDLDPVDRGDLAPRERAPERDHVPEHGVQLRFVADPRAEVRIGLLVRRRQSRRG